MALTYADESQGHTGTIYKATNWRYLGRTKPEPRWVDGYGRQVSKLSTKSRTTEQMRRMGYVVEGKFCKHKFAYIFQVGVAQAVIAGFQALKENLAVGP